MSKVSVHELSQEEFMELLKAAGEDSNPDRRRTSVYLFSTAGDLQAHISAILQKKVGDFVENLDGEQGVFAGVEDEHALVFVTAEMPSLPEDEPIFYHRLERWPFPCIKTGWGRPEEGDELERRSKQANCLERLSAQKPEGNA